MRRLLVTGGAGFIGTNFVYHWLGAHPRDRLVVLDALSYAGNAANLDAAQEDARFRFVRGDIGDAVLVDELMAAEGIDTIVHFAAESHVDRSIEGPDVFLETNVLGTHALLKAARKAWPGGVARASGRPGRFHHVSTDEVFGSLSPDEPPSREDSPYAPNSPYAASKAASDHLVRAYHHTFGVPVTTSNCSNNYGPYQFPEKLIPLMVVNALRGVALPVYGDGQNIRDWLHVEDHCRGIEQVLVDGTVGETYNLGGNSQETNLDLVHALCRAIDDAFADAPALAERFPDCPASRGEPTVALLTFVTDRPGHDRRYAIDISKAERTLGFRPRLAFADGLRRTVGWYLEHEPWWRALLAAG